jgi:hypothetical protein
LKATSVTRNITQLTRIRFVNAFLVREDDGFTLVDTTLPRGAEALSAARSLGWLPRIAPEAAPEPARA